MLKRITLAVVLILLSTFLISQINLTGRAVEGKCSDANNYYLCIDGGGDVVLRGLAVQQSQFTDIVNNHKCRYVSLDSNENFIFRYKDNAIGGFVYDSNKDIIGINSNSHKSANYECYVESNCSLKCSIYRIFE